MPHLLKQRYLITDTLGRGGMGVVYKAHDTQLRNRLVAIKEMQQSSDDQMAADAFKHEAEILAHLMHPHLPSIHEHFMESGYWYLVMEFIEGQTLEKYVQAKGGWLPYNEVIEIGLQLCTILDYLHTRQPPIIFRDLKPLNIMLSQWASLFD
jgi:serine/threonine protein kinase